MPRQSPHCLNTTPSLRDPCTYFIVICPHYTPNRSHPRSHHYRTAPAPAPAQAHSPSLHPAARVIDLLDRLIATRAHLQLLLSPTPTPTPTPNREILSLSIDAPTRPRPSPSHLSDPVPTPSITASTAICPFHLQSSAQGIITLKLRPHGANGLLSPPQPKIPEERSRACGLGIASSGLKRNGILLHLEHRMKRL